MNAYAVLNEAMSASWIWGNHIVLYAGLHQQMKRVVTKVTILVSQQIR